tara:strand:- start:25883 stop:26485 length:603 start_codon:yes stop_codon:yes gene_type:complete
MKKDNTVLMRMARQSLEGKWGVAIPTIFIYLLITGGLQGVIEAFPLASIVSLIVTGPLVLGIAGFALNICRGKEAKIAQLFQGFDNFFTSTVAYILMLLFVFLWMILFIIPGLIAALSYSMTFFIIADDNSIDGFEALKKSKQMMKGYKWKYFCLNLRFLGWLVLCILSLGIGFLWLIPYVQVTNANFYEDIKDSALENE